MEYQLGYQNLLLIAIGIIIVSIAVVVAISFFNSRSASANRDALIADLNNLSSLANAYYRKSLKYGGGNNSFVGFQIPQQLVSTINGNYSSNVGDQSIILVGTGNQIGQDGTNPVRVTMVVGAGEIISTTLNN
jgi:type II secretory pathway pseudopilin PulG